MVQGAGLMILGSINDAITINLVVCEFGEVPYIKGMMPILSKVLSYLICIRFKRNKYL